MRSIKKAVAVGLFSLFLWVSPASGGGNLSIFDAPPDINNKQENTVKPPSPPNQEKNTPEITPPPIRPPSLPPNIDDEDEENDWEEDGVYDNDKSC
jgi:hypothetical protein